MVPWASEAGQGGPAQKRRMVIYPDSSDLINLCRGAAYIDISDLAQRLLAENHQIVLSLDTLIELSDPLRHGRILEVRRELNRLEVLPQIFINEARIRDMEIREAIRAFEQGREYNFAAVTPFASRIDRAIDVHGAPLYVEQNVGERLMRIPTD